MNGTIQRALLVLLALLTLFTIALGARALILQAQYQRFGDELPFTLESALYYRRVKMVYDTGRLPAHDAMVQYPEGINPWTTYTAGAEFIYAKLARFFPENVPVPHRIRWIEAGWFSLGIPFLALGLFAWRRSIGAAAWGSLFYALALSSVIRSTGQELSHENFALPLLIAHWAFSVWAPELRRRAARISAHAGAALMLALALCAWDLIQFYIALRLLHRVWREIRAPGNATAPKDGWWLEYAALLAVGLLDPYHRGQGWLLSAPMGLAHGLTILRILRGWLLPHTGAVRVRQIAAQGGVLLAVFLATLFARHFQISDGAYGHFTELLWAKLRYLNVKPEDPARLTFSQRILWVPALNSTDWSLLNMLFPVLLWLTIPFIFLLFWKSRKSPDPRVGELLFAWTISVVAFWFFARFHVFLSLFCCIAIGVGCSFIPSRAWWIKILTGVLIGTGLFAESAHTVQRPGQWGRVNVYFKELNELTAWLSRNVSPDPVLANFGVSGSIAAYGKCAVILHPKFENAELRQRVREYGEHLFLGDEKSFRDWADALGARYYVHAFGEFSRQQPELQMRYFVNAPDPAPDAAARGFEFDPENRIWFVPLWQNVKYAVFRIVTAAEEAVALQHVQRAEMAFERGEMDEVTRACMAAMEHFPRQPRALELLRMASALQASGFQTEAGSK